MFQTHNLRCGRVKKLSVMILANRANRLTSDYKTPSLRRKHDIARNRPKTGGMAPFQRPKIVSEMEKIGKIKYIRCLFVFAKLLEGAIE